MNGRRRNHGTTLGAKVALAALNGDKALAEMSAHRHRSGN